MRCRCSSSSRSRPDAAHRLGAIYAALARLEKKGFVRSGMSDARAQRGGRARRMFQVTPSGLRTARELHQVRERIWNTIAEGRRS